MLSRLSIPPIVKIFSVVIILIIGVAAVGTIYVIRQANVQTNSQASEPVDLPKKVSWPPVQNPASGSATKTQTSGSTNSKTTTPEETAPLPTEKPTTVKKATNPSWVYSGASKLSVLPIPNGLKNTLYLKFENDSFTGVSSINYLLTYNSGLTAIVRSAQGNIVPSANPIVKDTTTGLLSITRAIFLGTCSQNVCTTDTNMNSFKLTVTVSYQDATSDGLSLEAFAL
jgi:hypothetical protein